MVELLAREPVRHDAMPQPGMLGNLALHHLFAACRFSSIVAQVERDNAGRPLGAFWEEILHNSLGVAALTVTFLDSYADDLGLEGSALAPRRPTGTAAGQPNGRAADGVLGKYSAALLARTGKPLDRSVPVVRSVEALIRLRDEVVRMRAECLSQPGHHDKLTDQLQACFSLSVFFPGEAALPRAWASFSFASWALRTTVEFLDYVYAEAGLPSPVARFKEQLGQLCGRTMEAGAAEPTEPPVEPEAAPQA